MENFSTSRHVLLPRAANLATLAILACATWWSGAQRPQDSGGAATVAATSAHTGSGAVNPTGTTAGNSSSKRAPGQAALPGHQTLALSAAHAPAGVLQAGRWSGETHALPREAVMQPVGFLQPALPR